MCCQLASHLKVWTKVQMKCFSCESTLKIFLLNVGFVSVQQSKVQDKDVRKLRQSLDRPNVSFKHEFKHVALLRDTFLGRLTKKFYFYKNWTYSIIIIIIETEKSICPLKSVLCLGFCMQRHAPPQPVLLFAALSLALSPSISTCSAISMLYLCRSVYFCLPLSLFMHNKVHLCAPMQTNYLWKYYCPPSLFLYAHIYFYCNAFFMQILPSLTFSTFHTVT